MTIHTDLLVIGSGIAGLTFALDVADHAAVTVVTKRDQSESNTRYAQGGIATVMAADDTPEAHLKDTLVAGAGLCHELVVERCVREGPERLRELMARGAEFDRDDKGELSLTREGGHSARRVIHYADSTGAEVQRALVAAVAKHPNITLLEHHTAIDLIMLTQGYAWSGIMVCCVLGSRLSCARPQLACPCPSVCYRAP